MFWSNVLWYVKVYILKNYSIHYTLTLNTNVKKFPSDKINVTKNAFFFLSRAPTNHSLTFNSPFFFELKHKVHLPKSVRGIFFHFQFCLFSFCSIKSMDFLNLKRHNSFQNEVTEKPHTNLLPDHWVLIWNNKFENSIISACVDLPENWPGDELFKLAYVSFSQ